MTPSTALLVVLVVIASVLALLWLGLRAWRRSEERKTDQLHDRLRRMASSYDEPFRSPERRKQEPPHEH